MYERILLKRTLLCGGNVYEEGEYVYPNIPSDLLDEIKAGTGNVEVIKLRPVPRIIDLPIQVKAEEGTSSSSLERTVSIPNEEAIKSLKKPVRRARRVE
jgi:hypothetical protein